MKPFADQLKSVGQNIRVVRTMRNLTQAALADKVNITRAWVNKIEKGQDCRLGHFLAIAAALGIEPLALLKFFKDEENTERIQFLAQNI